MQVGDLIRNKATGEIGIITGVGEEDAKKWLTVEPVKKKSTLGSSIVYHAEYFEIISEHRGDYDNGD